MGAVLCCRMRLVLLITTRFVNSMVIWFGRFVRMIDLLTNGFLCLTRNRMRVRLLRAISATAVVFQSLWFVG